MIPHPSELERLVAAAFDAPDRGLCTHARDLAAWAAGDVPDDARAAFEAHFDTCAECRADLAAFEAAAPLWETPRPRKASWAPFRRPLPIALAAAAAFLVVLGVVAWRRPPPPAPVVAVTRDEPLPGLSERVPIKGRAFDVALVGAEWLQPNDHVDVLASVAHGEARDAVTLLQNVIVLRRDAAAGRATLLLLPEEAETILLAERHGPLRVALRHPRDLEYAQGNAPPLTAGDVLRDSRPALAERRRRLLSEAQPAPLAVDPDRLTPLAPSAAEAIPRGLRRVPVTLADRLPLVAGEHADVVAVLTDPATKELVATTLLHAVPIADVGAAGRVLLLLLPEEAERLHLAGDAAIRLSLRHPRDTELEEQPTVAVNTRTLLTGQRTKVLTSHRHASLQSIQVFRGSSHTPRDAVGTNQHRDWGVGGFTETSKDARSTFAIDVDTAAYGFLRRTVADGSLPPPEAIRVEELLNSFAWNYHPPEKEAFSVHVDGAPSPFTPGRHLLRVGIRGRDVPAAARKPAHLVFLVDVSGSMAAADRLPLARRALRLLVDQLGPRDTVALVTYASESRLVLRPTPATRRAEILGAIDALEAGGSTGMADGLQTAYDLAQPDARRGHVARVIVLSDGDANLGPSSHEEMLALVRRGVDAGVTLTTVGFGTGNLQDETMEQLANRGNGEYHYVGSLFDAQKLFVTELGGTLEVIAKDVKIQVAFDPRAVRRYRLVGYENRDVADDDFRDDAVDGGEIGSGHRVTALYELELAGPPAGRLATVHVRWKEPDAARADETRHEVTADAFAPTFEQASPDLRFAAGVMGAGEKLRGSAFAAGWSDAEIDQLACEGRDVAEREAFCALWKRAQGLRPAPGEGR